MTPADLNPGFDKIASHLAEAIEAAKFEVEPAPYIFFENAFPTAFYEWILQNMECSLPQFEEVAHRPNSFESYSDQRILMIPPRASAGEFPGMEFWRELSRILQSKAVLDAIRVKFRSGLAARFGRDLSLRQLTGKTFPTLMLAQHRKNFFLGPHTDAANKVVTCIFYCAERLGMDEVGTAMYRPCREGLTCDGSVHHDPAQFIHTHTVPFRPNAAFMFVRNDRLFHGVESLKAEALGASRRMNIQFNLWQKPSLLRRVIRKGQELGRRWYPSR